MATEQVRGHISHLRIIPFKSCGVLEVAGKDGQMTPEIERARLTMSGLKTLEGVHDHRYMFVRKEVKTWGVREKVTQRDKRDEQDRTQGFSDLAQIKPQFMNGDLYLTWNREDKIVVPLDYDKGKIIPVEIWDNVCWAIDQGEELANWASEHLNYPVRLVKAYGERFQRMANQNYMRSNNPVLFHDGYPIHWFSEESVAEFNQRARVVVDNSEGKLRYNETQWQAFRPQIVVRGIPAQAEHLIHEGVVGGLIFYDPKPCDRCPMPRVNQETGELNSLDPNTVLATYKAWKNIRGQTKVIFGENMNPQGTVEIAVGDPIEAGEMRDPVLIYGNIKEISARRRGGS